MPTHTDNGQMTFWQHLDELRYVLIRIIAVSALFAIAAFVMKEQVFDILLAPQDSDFITYRWFEALGMLTGSESVEGFSIQLISTALSAQFFIHIKTAAYVGLIAALPYTLLQIFRFLSPALYSNERRNVVYATSSGYVMFMLGVAVCYFIIFPLTFRFLGTYQVSSGVENMISIQSYIDTFITMTMLMGVMFELPVLCWLMSKAGMLTASFMRRFRRHAAVLILAVAAIITPTADAFTMIAVAMPIYVLYELSILIVSLTTRSNKASLSQAVTDI